MKDFDILCLTFNSDFGRLFSSCSVLYFFQQQNPDGNNLYFKNENNTLTFEYEPDLENEKNLSRLIALKFGESHLTNL